MEHLIAKEKGCWAEQMVFGFVVRSKEAERVGDRPLQPEHVQVAPTPLQTWPGVWREGGNSAGGAMGEGRPWGLRVSGCGKARMEAQRGGMLPGAGTGAGSSASRAGHGPLGSVTQDPGEELRRDGCLQGSGTKVRERWIKSKPLAALSS